MMPIGCFFGCCAGINASARIGTGADIARAQGRLTGRALVGLRKLEYRYRLQQVLCLVL